VLGCFDCRNLAAFVQVSSRRDARTLTQTASHGLKAATWDRPDDRDPGVYCAQCGHGLEADTRALGLVDDRVDFVRPQSFDVDSSAAELMGLRPDATWSELLVPARDAMFGPMPTRLHPAIVEGLQRTGRRELFTHQVSAIAGALRGANVVQATAAGSGKSLGLLVPVLDALLRDPSATAIAVFPLLALANDQLSALSRFGLRPDEWRNESSFDLVLDPDLPAIRVARYDSATFEHEKLEARGYGRLLVTTPDSIHASVLRMAARRYADGSSWFALLRGLSYVVLDEIHVYQGVFGSNVANVIRRLRRAAAWHGGDPRFLLASATIGNPLELAESLTGTGPFALVDNDGSPQRARRILICNPPMSSEQTLKRAAAVSGKEIENVGRVAPQTVAIDLVVNGALASPAHPPVRTICFGRSRVEVFALTKRIKGRLKDLHAAELADMVEPYAATLLSDDRVRAEGKLRDGSTLAVVSTNALELGIDVPDLSIAVLCGYPGQVSSFRQRAGRVGRVGQGLVVLIVGDDPLQQFIARDPSALEALLAGRAEDVVINPAAPEIVRRYGLAAGSDDLGGVAFEDCVYFGEDAVNGWLADAAGSPDVEHRGVAYWRQPSPPDSYPSLRSSGANASYLVVAKAGAERTPVGVIDAATAPRDAFVGAIWSGPEHLYRVVGFDEKSHQIFCEGPIDSPYLTRGIPVDTVTVDADLVAVRALSTARAGYAELSIQRSVFSYKQVLISGGEHTHPVESPRWPPVTFRTEGLHLRLDAGWTAGLGCDPRDAVKGLEHVLLSLSPVVVACDPNDLNAASDGATIYLYDSFGSGIGLSRVAFERLEEIVDLGHRLVTSCACQNGCPSCVFLARRPDGNQGVSKSGAIALLARLRSARRSEASPTMAGPAT
jgi:DEAD/DEAH box helicase domain-containing protein